MATRETGRYNGHIADYREPKARTAPPLPVPHTKGRRSLPASAFRVDIHSRRCGLLALLRERSTARSRGHGAQVARLVETTVHTDSISGRNRSKSTKVILVGRRRPPEQVPIAAG